VYLIFRKADDSLTVYLKSLSAELFYRVSIKSFPDYEHLLQEDYVTPAGYVTVT